jgi:hypothetical protein
MYFAIDGCKLPSNASREWSGTIKEPGKEKKKDMEGMISKIITQHIKPDREEKRVVIYKV